MHELCLGGQENEWAGNGRCQGTETESTCLWEGAAAGCGWRGKWEVMGVEVVWNSKGPGRLWRGGVRNLDFILQGKPWREEGVGAREVCIRDPVVSPRSIPANILLLA